MNKIKKKTTQKKMKEEFVEFPNANHNKKRKETKKHIKNDKKKVKKRFICFKTVNDINTCNTHFIP